MTSLTDKEIGIAWRNLHYQTTSFNGSSIFKPNEKSSAITILQPVSGHFEVGTLNALLGPSGAGKSTLLNCLSGKCPIKGDLYLNKGFNFSQKSCSTSFIEQQVQLSINGRLTVGELLHYAFSFKNYQHTKNEDSNLLTNSKEYIKSVISELRLDEAILKRRFELCSGGEQKRVAIAQELMCLEKKPSLLFVDEPTTGLDGSAALEVITCLQKLTISTMYRMTVVVSIHSPSSAILSLFNKLYVLAKGGVCVYSGPPENLAGYLQASGLQDSKSHNFLHNQPAIEVLLKAACTGIFIKNFK